MFKVISYITRVNTEIPWNIPMTDEYKKVFFEKYLSTKKFLSEKSTYSDDNLSLEKVICWATEKDYLDFITESDVRISSWLEQNMLHRNSGNFTENMIYSDESNGDFYQQEHIFLVFRPGAAGNFVTGLLDNLLNSQLTGLSFSSSGHAHFNSIVERKKQGIDYISLGMGLHGIDPEFFSVDEKIDYYVKKINSASYENRPHITWTHNYENIPLYKSLFPNCKILVITTDSFRERLVSLIMSLVKNYFSDDNHLPLPANVKLKSKILKIKFIKEYFKKYYGNKKYQEDHSLGLFLMLRGHLDAQKIDLNTDQDTDIPYDDDDTDSTLTSLQRKVQYSVGIENTEQADCILKFKDILGANIVGLSKVLESLLGRQLTTEELLYIEQSTLKYIDTQDQLLLLSPIEYINRLKEKAENAVGSFDNI